MFNLILTIQIIVTIVCFISVLIVAFQKSSSYSNIILITMICTFIQNAGYILELIAKDASQAMSAVRTEYLGGAFEIGLITFFMFRYCGIELNNLIKGFLIIEACLVVLGVWTSDFIHIFYTNISFVSDAKIPHLVLQHGWLFYFFEVTTIVELVACIFILAVSALRTNQEHMKLNYYILILVVSVPLVGFLVSVSGLIKEFDSTPLNAAIAVGIFAFAIARKHVFDVAGAAGEDLLTNLENPIIVLNNDNGYEYSNIKAEELFPDLKITRRGAAIENPAIINIFNVTEKEPATIGSRLFEVSVNRVRSGDEIIGKTAILFDVTDSRDQIKQMKELKEEAEEANKSKSVFLANVTHEIRTPINVIMGMSEVLLRDHVTDESKEYIQNVRNAGNTLLDLTSDIFDYSKIESGMLEVTNDKFDLRTGLNDIVNIYQFRCKQKGLCFICDIAPDIPRYLIGDQLRIRQITTNILSNAVKFTERGSVKFKLSYKRRSDYDVDLMMVVEDTGIGIRLEDQDKIFTGFGREKMTMSRYIGGTGLGLNITKKLIEMMGGLINFKSEYGKGTVFSIVIPLISTTDSLETLGDGIGREEVEEVFTPPFTAPDSEILIVDDSPINQKVMEELLKEMKPILTIVSSGEECLQYVREKHYDMIFMDHRMAGMDGVETFSRIRQSDNECKDTPVVMVTANATIEAKDFYISKGFADFLPMPVSVKQLCNMLYKYLPERLIIMN